MKPGPGDKTKTTPVKETSDARLVEETLAGDHDAFRVLIRRYQTPTYALALSRVRNGAVADEVAEDAIVSAYKKLLQLKDRNRFAAWLRSITLRCCALCHAIRHGIRVRLWDFLFYGLFGLVVTSFVHIGGVLLVFSYLIVPAVCASFLVDSLAARLAVGWVTATMGSLIGLYASSSLDLPTGAAIVCALGALLLVTAAVAQCRHRMHRKAV